MGEGVVVEIDQALVLDVLLLLCADQDGLLSPVLYWYKHDLVCPFGHCQYHIASHLFARSYPIDKLIVCNPCEQFACTSPPQISEKLVCVRPAT